MEIMQMYTIRDADYAIIVMQAFKAISPCSRVEIEFPR